MAIVANKNTTSGINLLDIDSHNLFVSRKLANDPAEILNVIGVSAGQTVADFGCGVGHFILELAKKVGENGKVVAIDIDRKMLDVVKDAALASGFRNIYGVQADLQIPGATKMGSGSVDLVLIINLLYFVEKREAVLAEAARILKKGGRMAIMEWSEKGSIKAIKDGTYISGAEIKLIAQELGFKFLQERIASISHEVIVFEKL